MSDLNKNYFSSGKHYQVLQYFKLNNHNFDAGEVLTFVSEAYSRYDSAYTFTFRDDNGQSKVWWLHEDEPEDAWHKYFKENQD